MSQFGHRVFGDVQIAVIDRLGGHSSGAFDSMNLASYVGDDSENVSRNLKIAAGYVGATSVAVMNAEHSNAVHVVSDASECAKGDGLVTRETGLALAALSADCLTAALVDVESGIIGVMHAGWKGVRDNVARATAETMVTQGATLDNIVAVIGPSICPKCYQVPSDRVEQFIDTCPEAIYDERQLDLQAGVWAQFDELGISTQVIDACTFEDQNFFSYRRANGQPTGRGGLIVARAGA